jgi:hypothetical protein
MQYSHVPVSGFPEFVENLSSIFMAKLTDTSSSSVALGRLFALVPACDKTGSAFEV